MFADHDNVIPFPQPQDHLNQEMEILDESLAGVRHFLNLSPKQRALQLAAAPDPLHLVGEMARATTRIHRALLSRSRFI